MAQQHSLLVHQISPALLFSKSFLFFRSFFPPTFRLTLGMHFAIFIFELHFFLVKYLLKKILIVAWPLESKFLQTIFSIISFLFNQIKRVFHLTIFPPPQTKHHEKNLKLFFSLNFSILFSFSIILLFNFFNKTIPEAWEVSFAYGLTCEWFRFHT